MITNEAPEKIYLNPLLMEDGESIVRRCTFERQRDSQVEYTRTDAFIEKACKFLNSSSILRNTNIVEKFKEYMKRTNMKKHKYERCCYNCKYRWNGCEKKFSVMVCDNFKYDSISKSM